MFWITILSRSIVSRPSRNVGEQPVRALAGAADHGRQVRLREWPAPAHHAGRTRLGVLGEADEAHRQATGQIQETTLLHLAGQSPQFGHYAGQ
jgi:hypothetical protein